MFRKGFLVFGFLGVVAFGGTLASVVDKQGIGFGRVLLLAHKRGALRIPNLVQVFAFRPLLRDCFLFVAAAQNHDGQRIGGDDDC